MPWSSASDEALLRATPAEPDAFAELYDRYESALVGYLLRRTGNVEVAVDLASEAFATALAAAHRYAPAPGRPAAAWLFTIAQNILRDSLRRGRVEAQARRRIGICEAIEYGEEELERIEGSGQPCRLTFAVYRLPAESHMLWLSPDGKVVNHALIRLPLYVGTHHPPPGSKRLDPRCASTG